MSQAIPIGGSRRLILSLCFLLHLIEGLFLIVIQNNAVESNNPKLKLPPHHLIHNPRIRLYNLNDLRRNILIDIIRHGNTVIARGIHGYGCINRLEKRAGVDAGNEEAGFVQGLWALGAGPDANRRERMPNRGKEGRLLREGTAVGHHCEGVHLQAVVIMEAEGLVLDDARVEFKARGLQPFPRARMARIKDRHIILLRHSVDGREEREEVLFRVDVFLTVRRQEDVSTFLQPQTLMDIRRLNLGKILVKDLRHRRARHIGAFLRETAISQIPAGVLGVGHVDIGDDVDNPAVRLFREAFVLAAVAGFHVEDRDVQPFRTNH